MKRPLIHLHLEPFLHAVIGPVARFDPGGPRATCRYLSLSHPRIR